MGPEEIGARRPLTDGSSLHEGEQEGVVSARKSLHDDDGAWRQPAPAPEPEVAARQPAPAPEPEVAARRSAARDEPEVAARRSAARDEAEWSEPPRRSGRGASVRAPRSGKRAAALLAMTAFLPGRAQAAAGPRPIGRLAILITLACWAVLALTAIGFLVLRGATINTIISPVLAPVICTVLVGLGIGWALLWLMTLWAAKPGSLGPAKGGAVAVATLLLMAVTSGTLFAAAYSLNAATQAFNSMFADGDEVKPVNGRYNILLLGGDGGSDRTGRRPDSLSVLSIDAATGDTVSIAIPRNLQNAPFPESSPLHAVYPEGYNCGDDCIINTLYGTVNQDYAHLYPGAKDAGAKAMMDAASGVTGLTVTGYFLLDMGGFSEMVDAMGGVSVNSGGWVPVTSGEIPGTSPVRHYPPSEWMAPGRLTLDGYHAEWFARSREFASDYNRIKRQQCVQSAMVNKLSPALLASRFGAIAKAGSTLAETNIARNRIGYIVDAGLRSRGKEQRRLTVGAPDFPDLFSTYPDFDLVHTRVRDLVSDAPSASTGAVRAPVAAALPRLGAAPWAPASVVVPQAATKAPDGTPITPEYLNRLAQERDDDTLAAIVKDNGNCTPAE
ncbi:LCP family protein [Falsarthrobacter nasiphocae]|uniref:LCP family protein required for cell wall assembly n=1 Tax=Falsarthrobacter nasiphocae TaxID=189863 RepID=A0AAE3YGZ5_9MICC|nr:LCP family protein [Falsarthrobacter nasiphocae]MDR6891631.1 LCP family protein required for cell wall assembly [Falsarthrobacter nasiphocae]